MANMGKCETHPIEECVCMCACGALFEKRTRYVVSVHVIERSDSG